MLIAHFLLHWLFSECSVRVACFSLNHLSHRRRWKDERGDNGNVWKQGSCAYLFAFFWREIQESPRLSPPSWHIGLPVHGHHINCAQKIISKTCNWPPIQSQKISFLLLHARAQIGRGFGGAVARKAKTTSSSIWNEPLLIFQNVGYAWGFEEMSSPFPSHLPVEKRDHDGELWPKKGIKQESGSEWSPLSYRGRRAHMWSGLKDLVEEER